MNDTLLALDIGTSGLKAALVSADTGQTVAAQTAAYSTFYAADGTAEQNPADWHAAAIKACAALHAQWPREMDSIAAVACTGMMNGVVLTDAQGNALGPAVLHADTRAAAQCEQLTAALGADALYAATSNRPDSRLSLPKVMRLQQTQPALVNRAAFVVQAKDFLACKLTGRAGVTDPSDASLTGAYDVSNRQWRTDIWQAAGLSVRLLPQVLPSASVIGHVQNAHILPGVRQGVPVVCGGGDGPCATAGAGVGDRESYLYLGGTAWIGLKTNAPLLDSRLSAYCCLDDGVTVFGTAQAAGTSTDWLRGVVGQSLADLDAQAARIAPGADGLFFLPYLQGERAPVWDTHARGVFFGLSTAHGAAHLLRAVREGVAFALASICDVLAENGHALNPLRVLGGGGASDLWNEMLPAVLNRSLLPVRDGSSATARGAALCAGVGIGLWANWGAALATVQTLAPRPVNVQTADAYVPLRAFYNTLYPAFAERFAALSRLAPPA